MMKNRFLLFVIVLTASIGITAGEAESYKKIGQVPYTQYLTSIKFNPETQKLSFTDTYRIDHTYDRTYQIELYERSEDYSLYKIDKPYLANEFRDHAIYFYGNLMDGAGYNTKKNSSYKTGQNTTFFNSNGGPMEITIDEIIGKAYQMGLSHIMLAIQPMYNTNGGENLCYEDNKPRTSIDHIVGCHLNNRIMISLPLFNRVSLETPSKVNYGETLTIGGFIQSFGQTIYTLQESKDKKSWHTKAAGVFTLAEARNGKRINYQRTLDDFDTGKDLYYRMIAQDLNSKKSDTSEIAAIQIYYPLTIDGKTSFLQADEEFTLSPEDCKAILFKSNLPVLRTMSGTSFICTMPSCPVEITYTTPSFEITFLNADYTLLKRTRVDCGSDATSIAPEATMGDLVFKGWSQDISAIYSNMTVVACYEMEADFRFQPSLTSHTNDRYSFHNFAGSETRAMVGDSLTFHIDVHTPTEAKLTCQRATTKDSKDQWEWNNSTEISEYVCKQVVAMDGNNEINGLKKEAFRFVLTYEGMTIYSAPYEFDIYYPLQINSQIKENNTFERLWVENETGDFDFSTTCVIPSRYQDTIRIYRLNGKEDACMMIDNISSSYIIAPGKPEMVQVTVSSETVVFEVEGNPYYTETVNCGSNVQNNPSEPQKEGYFFAGWKKEEGNSLTFAAQFEKIPTLPFHTIRFFDKDSNLIGSEQTIQEGESAVAPNAPEVEGLHFVGWSHEYVNITEDLDIQALYGVDNIIHTILYFDEDDITPLGEEIVADGMSARGTIVAHEGKIFKHWVNVSTQEVENLQHITKDMHVKAVFEFKVYTVTFCVEGVITFTIQVPYGTDPSNIEYYAATPTKPATQALLYTFAGWTPKVNTITSDITFDALFTESPRTYTVTFRNWDLQVIETQEVEYGKAAKEPESTPTREGYDFIGWDKEFANITEDLTVTALFEERKEPKPEDQGIEHSANIHSQETKKVIKDGQFLILRGNKTYTATGI